jgi:O-antigen ligase
MIFFLGSRTAIFAFVLIFPLFLILKGLQVNKGKWLLPLTLAVLILMISLGIRFISSYNRFPQITQGLEYFNKSDLSALKGDEINSTTERLAFWKAGIMVFQNNWLFGVGTGDLRPECKEVFRKLNFDYGVKEFKTSHNQYLQTAVILGIPGLLILLLGWLIPMILAFQQKYYVYACFILIFMINGFTESLLSASGVLLYAFFNAYFCRVYLSRNKESII